MEVRVKAGATVGLGLALGLGLGLGLGRGCLLPNTVGAHGHNQHLPPLHMVRGTTRRLGLG